MLRRSTTIGFIIGTLTLSLVGLLSAPAVSASQAVNPAALGKVVRGHVITHPKPVDSPWFQKYMAKAFVTPNTDRFECTYDRAYVQQLGTVGEVLFTYWHGANWCVDLNKSTIAPHAPEVTWGVTTHWGWSWGGTVTSRQGWAGGDWPYIYKDYREGQFQLVIKGFPTTRYPTLSRCYYWNASAHHC